MQEFQRYQDGTLYKFSEYGLYPLMYLTGRGDVLCAACADEAIRIGDDPPIACEANWEEPSLHCYDCGIRIESAYTEYEVTEDVA
jgi:hypothetical protein